MRILCLFAFLAGCSNGPPMPPVAEFLAADSGVVVKQSYTASGTPYQRILLFPAGGLTKAQIFVRNDNAGEPVTAFLYCHGSGGNENDFNGSVFTEMRDSLMNSGQWVVIQSKAGGANWGNNDGIADYEAAWGYANRTLNVTGTATYATSMGGLPCLNLIHNGNVPNIFAHIGAASVTNFRAIWEHPYFDFTNSIRSAYFPGITKTLAHFLTYTAGHDPTLWPDSALAGVAFKLFASPEDSTVLFFHATDWVAKVGPYSPIADIDTVSGPHDGSDFYRAVPTMEFLNAWKP